jgi:cytochrome c peroxidase
MNQKVVTVLVVILFLATVAFQIADVDLHLLQSPGAEVANYQESDYNLGSSYVDSLKTYPDLKKGERQPFELWEYAGRGKSSFGSPELPMPFDEWLAFHEKQKPQLMKDVDAYMASRFDFNGKVVDGKYMSGGRKPIMAGPIARLPQSIDSFEALAELTPE